MKQTICLNMIVKNERHVIQRCLSSIKHLIDYWVIVDTGSTDGTQQAIRNYLHDIPGELYERPWVDFAHNRNEALDLARGKADYFLFIDADDRLVFFPSFTLPDLDKEFYLVQQSHGNAYQPIVLLLKDLPKYRWEGAVHETITLDIRQDHGLLEGVVNEYLHDGARSQDPNRYMNDVRMLKQALRKDPTNLRNLYYLAQSYVGAEKYPQAIKYYKRRAAVGGIDHEVYFSHYYTGLLQMRLRESSEDFLKNLCQAYLSRPTRAEPLYQIVGYYLETQNYFLGYLVAKMGISIPQPVDVYVEPQVYDWDMLYRYYLCAKECGKIQQARAAAEKLRNNPRFPHQL